MPDFGRDTGKEPPDKTLRQPVSDQIGNQAKRHGQGIEGCGVHPILRQLRRDPFDDPALRDEVATLKGKGGDVWAVGFSHDGKLLAVTDGRYPPGRSCTHAEATGSVK